MSYRDSFLGHHLEFLRGPPTKLLSHRNNMKITIFIQFWQKPGCADIFSSKSLFSPRYASYALLWHYFLAKVARTDPFPPPPQNNIDLDMSHNDFCSFYPGFGARNLLHSVTGGWTTLFWGGGGQTDKLVWQSRTAQSHFWENFLKFDIFILFWSQSNFLGGPRRNLTIHLSIGHLY